MELKQLQYFMAVCEELHFSRAAERMGVSAPNISQQIRALEEELGMLLFDRVGRKIVLTDAGAILREHGSAALGQLRQASDAIADLKHKQGGALSIGVLPGDADLLFNALLLDFHRAYPQVSVSLLETMKVTEQVLDRSLDIGVTISPVADERLTAIPLFREEFALAVDSRHPLAAESAVPLAKLASLRLVLFPGDHQCRRLLEQCCGEQGFRVQPHMEATTLVTLLRMVEQGIGACVLPRLLLENLDRPDIRTLRLIQPTPSQDICLVYRSDRYVGYAMRTFIKTLRHSIEAAIRHAKIS
ncbi:LysR family transcriptional regulator [Cohnella rhizosphaerae]|uniref:LysR substrate-binding domain-containing protein n=1 Tax=Cohnella rhizosphaerae TaxID=1457232 RepID=A0A9X4L5L9_9BACL|nr:LysR substrate-binding domain-containing protein [Cohnella rhizosphaerae]MDG0814344.1 LysR substrate-binding domain-containing protein [Cohnella rhizosphaerae]